MTKAIELLRRLEWSGSTSGPPTGMGLNNGEDCDCCPVCGGLRKHYGGFIASAVGHKPGCELEAILKAEGGRIIIHNVTDKRRDWVGSWEAEPLDVCALTPEDVGRTVIYRDHGRAEAGTLRGWTVSTVWACFHKGDTAAACNPKDLMLAVRSLDGPITEETEEEEC